MTAGVALIADVIRTPLVATSILTLGPGCYLGQGNTGKTIAYTVNGALALGGLGMLVAGNTHAESPSNPLGDALGDLEDDTYGVVAVVVGVTGLVSNLAASRAPNARPVTGRLIAPSGVSLQSLRFE